MKPYKFKREIKISKDIIIGDEPLDDFTMLMNLDTPEFPNIKDAKNISFYADESLQHKINARKDHDFKEGEHFWVNIPKLFKDKDTIIYVAYNI